MGKVEKVIVLSVLFLIALILVVSLTVDDPLDKSRVVEAGAPKGRPAGAVQTAGEIAAAPDAAKAPGALSTQITPPTGATGLETSLAPSPTPIDPLSIPAGTAGQAPEPALLGASPQTGALGFPAGAPGLPAGALLKTLDGLQDSILTDMKLYTWKENDTYRAIAQKYYGDWKKFTVLRRSNEGRNDVQPGENIFVPVFDSDPVAPVAGTAKGAKVATDASGKSDPSAKKGAARTTGGKVHIVKEGESLWKIAKTELGNGGRWEEIYELNKDVIPASKALHAGQSLRIP